MPVTWSDEKRILLSDENLILLYCPGRGSNSRPSAHRGFKHGQGVPRPYSLGHGGGTRGQGYINSRRTTAKGMVQQLGREEEVRFVDLWDSFVGKE